MAHHINHRHSHTEFISIKPVILALSLNLVFLIVELIGAILTNSLALLADVGHMITDIVALSVVMIATYYSRKPKTSKHTYGFLRGEIIGAFLNGILLLIICGYILFEAIRRITIEQIDIDPAGVIILGIAGIIINGTSALILYPGAKKNLNLRGAFLHLLSDVLGSAGALTSGIIIYMTGWYPADTLVSLFIVLLILRNAIPLIKESIRILLEGSPESIDIDQIAEDLKNLSYVAEIHDLHVWLLNQNQYLLSCHLCLKPEHQNLEFWEKCLCEAEDILSIRYGINHTTLQVEPLDYKINHSTNC